MCPQELRDCFTSEPDRNLGGKKEICFWLFQVDRSLLRGLIWRKKTKTPLLIHLGAGTHHQLGLRSWTGREEGNSAKSEDCRARRDSCRITAGLALERTRASALNSELFSRVLNIEVTLRYFFLLA